MKREIIVSGREDFLVSSKMFKNEVRESLEQSPDLKCHEDYVQAQFDVIEALKHHNTVSISVDQDNGLQIVGLKKRNRSVDFHRTTSVSIDNGDVFQTCENTSVCNTSATGWTELNIKSPHIL